MTRHVMRAVLGILICAPMLSAGEPTPPVPVPTPNPLLIPKGATNPQQIVDFKPYLEDFQSTDPIKQQAATKVIIESGSRGYNALNMLLKNPNADVVKRATAARAEIDQRSLGLYKDVEAQRQKMAKQPLTVAAVDAMRQAWINMSMYASQNQLKQFGFQQAGEMQKQVETIKTATQQIEQLDAQLKGTADLKGLARASLQLDRAQALKTLQRDADALAAAQDAAAASGKEGRLTPPILKVLVEIYLRAEDAKNSEASCRQILADYPRSLETKFAHKTLIELIMNAKRWDESFAAVKAYVAAFPVDEEAQEMAYTLMETLMNDEADYKRVGPVADWLIETLPLDRLKPETAKLSGGCNEYIVKDYAKALRSYTLLRDKFSDIVSADDMNAALSRLTAKSEGKFPKEPAETEPGAAGAFASFLKAIRSRDAKLIATVVPKEDVEEYVDNMKDGSDEKVPALTFADFIIKKVEPDAKGETAKLTIDYYEAGSIKPKAITQTAVMEDGKWKVRWEDPDDAAEEISTKIPVGPAPAVPPKVLPGKP